MMDCEDNSIRFKCGHIVLRCMDEQLSHNVLTLRDVQTYEGALGNFAVSKCKAVVLKKNFLL